MRTDSSGWLCWGAGEATRLTTTLVRVFYNDDYDDGGRRTTLTLKVNGVEERHALPGDARPLVRAGHAYTFVLRSRNWNGSKVVDLVELLDGQRSIYREASRFSLDSKVVVDGARGELEYSAGGERHRIPVAPAVLRLRLDPTRAYSLSFYERERDGSFCRKLEGIGEQDPTRTVEAFDERLGPYEVPAIHVLWAADGD